MRCWILGALLLGCGSSAESAPPPSEVPSIEETTTTEAPGVTEVADDPPTDPDLPGGPADQAPPAEEYFPGVPAYPNARFLCSQHITGTNQHVNWSGYATADDLATVRAFYEARFYAPGRAPSPAVFEPNGDGFSVRADGGRSLNVQLVSGPHPSCDVAPSADDRTYLVVSTMSQ